MKKKELICSGADACSKAELKYDTEIVCAHKKPHTFKKPVSKNSTMGSCLPRTCPTANIKVKCIAFAVGTSFYCPYGYMEGNRINEEHDECIQCGFKEECVNHDDEDASIPDDEDTEDVGDNRIKFEDFDCPKVWDAKVFNEHFHQCKECTYKFECEGETKNIFEEYQCFRDKIYDPFNPICVNCEYAHICTEEDEPAPKDVTEEFKCPRHLNKNKFNELVSTCLDCINRVACLNNSAKAPVDKPKPESEFECKRAIDKHRYSAFVGICLSCVNGGECKKTEFTVKDTELKKFKAYDCNKLWARKIYDSSYYSCSKCDFAKVCMTLTHADKRKVGSIIV